MNITLFPNLQKNTYTPAFKAKLSKPEELMIRVLSADIVEITRKPGVLMPQKLEFSEVEEQFKDLIHERKCTEYNIIIQKQNLRMYYSAQDKYDYKELLKNKRGIVAQIQKLAKKIGINELDVEYAISVKKEYNKYAPKIFRAKSLEELNNVEKLISSDEPSLNAQKLLAQLIEQKKQSL